MPHLELAYSANIIEKDNLTHLFEKCHSILAQGLPTEMKSCKSRAIENPIYRVGDGANKNAFVHLNLKIMPGRAEEVKQEIGQAFMEMLLEHFARSLQTLDLQITLEINELPQNYFKVTSK